MSTPLVLQENFSLGAMQDRARHRLPEGKVWNMTNLFPDLRDGAGGSYGPLVRRGAWRRNFDAMVTGSPFNAVAVGFAPFSGAPRVLGVGDTSRLYKWTPGSATTTDVGVAVTPAQVPTFYRGLALLFHAGGTSAPLKYDNTTLASLGGSPPTAAVSTVFKDHLVVARSNANRNRVWFSSTGNPESWDTAVDGQWLDCSRDVFGLATVRNMILVFEEGQVERIRGDIIPGVVGSDIVREPLLSTGCSDPSSLAVADDFVIFANSQGIYRCDGIGAVDLAQLCGMSDYYRAKMESYQSLSSISGVLWNDWYIFSHTIAGSSPPTICAAIHVPTATWVTLTNVNPSMMVAPPRGSPNVDSDFLWMAEWEAPRISDIGKMFTTPHNYQDGDGDAVAWTLETPYYMGRPGKKVWKAGYLTAQCSGSSTTTVTVERAANPGGANLQTYTTVGTLSFAGSGAYARKRLAIGKTQDGLGLRISGTPTADGVVVLHSIEADAWALDAGRL